uniref:Putative acyl carrier protein n=1 Tax=Streptomyces antibioticus TaxID=1890 RepID=G9VYU5_STRAT|nr:putative acyl carrier protein [Streptomyces antibioticus]
MATMAPEDKRLVKGIVCDILELESDEITDVSLFIEDHDADSMRLIEILSSLEVNLKVTIEQAELSRMVNLEGIYEVIGNIAR